MNLMDQEKCATIQKFVYLLAKLISQKPTILIELTQKETFHQELQELFLSNKNSKFATLIF